MALYKLFRLYRIVSYRIVSYLVSYRIVSYRIVSYRIVSYRIVRNCSQFYYNVHKMTNLCCFKHDNQQF